jgi:mxaL protein
MSAWRDARFCLGFAAFLLLLAGILLPSLPISRPIYDAMVVLDITGSMNVRDQTLDGVPASRLELEKRATRRLLAALPCGSRLGVAIFVETRPFLLFEPVETCGNAAPLDEEISGIDWRMAWDGESHIAIGLHNAMQTAKDLGADLIFMTDGQEVPPLWWTGAPNFDDVRGAARGLIAGVGGLTLSPIPKFDFSGRLIGTWKPGEIPSERNGLFHGREHLSAVDEPHLQSLANQSGLTYLHLTDAGALMDAFARAVPRRSRPSELDIRMVPAALGLLLLCLSQIGEGDAARVRRALYRVASSARMARKPSR